VFDEHRSKLQRCVAARGTLEALLLPCNYHLYSSLIAPSQVELQDRLAEAEDRASRQAWAHAEALQARAVHDITVFCCGADALRHEAYSSRSELSVLRRRQ
jgi:hypothetical protein